MLTQRRRAQVRGVRPLSVGLGILSGAAVFLVGVSLLHLRELQALLSLRRRSGTTD